MRSEALKAHGTRLWSTTLKQATRQLLLCYHRKPNQSAVCCSLRLNCTAVFQILVRSAVYTQTVDCTQERKKCALMLPFCPPWVTAGEKGKKIHVNKSDRCITWIIHLCSDKVWRMLSGNPAHDSWPQTGVNDICWWLLNTLIKTEHTGCSTHGSICLFLMFGELTAAYSNITGN